MVSELIEAAWLARETAYAPYSKFAVGAAILTKSGAIFGGCNVENISLGLTICAERAAAVSAIQAGENDWQGIAIAAKTTQPIVPCGACRQFLAEFNPALVIVSSGRGDAVSKKLLSDLLPSPRDGILDE